MPRLYYVKWTFVKQQIEFYEFGTHLASLENDWTRSSFTPVLADSVLSIGAFDSIVEPVVVLPPKVSPVVAAFVVDVDIFTLPSKSLEDRDIVPYDKK